MHVSAVRLSEAGPCCKHLSSSCREPESVIQPCSFICHMVNASHLFNVGFDHKVSLSGLAITHDHNLSETEQNRATKWWTTWCSTQCLYQSWITGLACWWLCVALCCHDKPRRTAPQITAMATIW